MKTSIELQNAVTEYCKGTKEAFNRVYVQSYGYLHTCIIHVVNDEDAAMDMLQETYIEICKSIHQLENPEKFLSWASMIANRKCFAYLKKQNKIVLLSQNNGEDETGDFFENIADNDAFIPESMLQDKEKQRLIKEIIDELSEIQRLCVIGFYYNEQKQEEIAQELGIPVNTVKSHLNRAKGKIREAVIELDEKKGTRLYSIAPFLLLFFGIEAEACKAAPMSEALMKAYEAAAMPDKPIKKTGMTLRLKKIIGSVAVITGVAVLGGAAVVGQLEKDETEAELSENADDLELQEKQVQEKEEEGEVVKEEKNTENDLTENEEQQVIPLEISENYAAYRRGNEGLIPVSDEEGNWGLVTYNNDIVVPLEYEYACWMVNPEGQSFFGKDGSYYVFDKEGTEIFNTDQMIRGIQDGVILTMEEVDFDTSFAYYDLDGNVLYESDEESDDKGAVVMSEGYAFLRDQYVVRMDRDGNILDMSTVAFSTEQTDAIETSGGGSMTGSNGEGENNLFEVPQGPVKEGYYLSRWHMSSSDLYGIFFIRSVDGVNSYEWDISSIFNQENLSFASSDVDWGLTSFYENGVKYYNYGTVMCAYIENNDRKTYYLVDVSKLKEQEYEYDVSNGYSEEDYWDFDMTAITEESLLAKADYIEISSEAYWLVGQDGKWGYIDHDGNVMAMYDDAVAFHDGYALVVENGEAYQIDENFSKIKDLGAAKGVRNYGEVDMVTTEEGEFMISLSCLQ